MGFLSIKGTGLKRRIVIAIVVIHSLDPNLQTAASCNGNGGRCLPYNPLSAQLLPMDRFIAPTNNRARIPRPYGGRAHKMASHPKIQENHSHVNGFGMRCNRKLGTDGTVQTKTWPVESCVNSRGEWIPWVPVIFRGGERELVRNTSLEGKVASGGEGSETFVEKNGTDGTGVT